VFVPFQIQSFDEGSVVSGMTGGPENMGKTFELHYVLTAATFIKWKNK
jgi:hypothetical protein